MWRPERDWDKEILDQYLIMSGWKPTDMRSVLNLVGFVADAMLGALKEKSPLMTPEQMRLIAPDRKYSYGWLVFIEEE